MDLLNVVFAGPYNALYVGGLAAGFGLAWWEGRRRGWPILPWLALLAACVAGGIVGSKLLHFDLHVADAGEKTILGGITGGMLALLLAQRFLRFGGASCSVLGPAVLLGLALGRVGCFLVGCCFGQVTTLPWGVQYGPGTAPFQAQLTGGLLEAGAAASLPVHPTQLYEAVAALLLALAFRRWSGRLRSTGAGALALAVGYGLVRFHVEFVRADGEVLMLGLTSVQWMVGLVMLVAALVLGWRERRANGAAPAAVAAEGHWRRGAALVGILLALWLVGREALTPLESFALLAALLPALSLLLGRLLRTVALPLAPGITAATFVLIPVAADTVPVYPRSYYTVGGSGNTGGFFSGRSIATGQWEETCNGRQEIMDDQYFEHSSMKGGVSVGYTQEDSPLQSHSASVRVFSGTERVTPLWSSRGTVLRESRSTVTGATLRGGTTFPLAGGWGGLTAGVTGGQLVKDAELMTTVRLLAGASAGTPAGWFVDLRYNDAELMASPNGQARLSAGYELERLGSNVQAGMSASEHQVGYFITGMWLTRQGLEVEPFLGFNRSASERYEHEVGKKSSSQAGVAVRQRFNPGAWRVRR